ncbi:MAG: two-component system sensor histidine kinase CreC [Nitrospirae bacterium]|nr:two-component system sensor histidine kinase CreC [Nitrospirota bacterium]
MSIRTRIFIGFIIVVCVGFSSLLYWSLDDFKPQFRKATEEPLVDASRVLASLAATTAKDGRVDVPLFRGMMDDAYARPFSADIYGFVKTGVDYRVYITDVSGVVIFDSRGGLDEGRDYGDWNDVKRTLQGRYGARSSEEVPGTPSTSIMYIASPIMIDGKLAGVLSVGKPTTSTNRFAEDAKRNITLITLIVGLSVVLVGMFISWRITAPINRLTDYARAVRDGERVTLPELGTGETRELGEAFEEMRAALEGKEYVENYVQTLTHEIKSPVSAIRGATELLAEEDMPPELRARFLDNIRAESERINVVVERLLLLSSLEKKTHLDYVQRLDMADILSGIKESLHPLLKAKRISLDVVDEGDSGFEGDPFLARQAVLNLVQNAVDFSPAGGTITVKAAGRDGSVVLTVRDRGEGIPEYASCRIFERFYSLKRPDTGKKSSGLGLCLVREVAALHKGSVELANAPDGGVIATLILPRRII